MGILNRNRIYFLLKDPYWSFLWWHVDWFDAIQQMVAIGGRGVADGGSPAFRVHDVTDIIFDGQNSHSYVEVNGIQRADHWYFQLPSPGRNYCAEIGIRRDSWWFVIARSNTLFVPRAGPSESWKEHWSIYQLT